MSIAHVYQAEALRARLLTWVCIPCCLNTCNGRNHFFVNRKDIKDMNYSEYTDGFRQATESENLSL